MSSTAELRTIANLFGVSKPFVCNCVKDVCEAVIKKMRSQFLFMPKGDYLKEVIDIYHSKWGFPMCAGAIDGTHIPIVSPSDNHTDYVNHKGYHSIVMQAVVDSKYLFRDTVIGWPGSVHDARVLANSEIYNLGNTGKLFPPDSLRISMVLEFQQSFSVTQHIPCCNGYSKLIQRTQILP